MSASSISSSKKRPSQATPQQYIHHLPNGLTLLAEYMPNVRSVGLNLLIPAGAASDPEGGTGAATVLSEWILRGAGNRDSRALTDYLDSLGVQRGSSAETVFLRLGASLLGQNLLVVLPVYADIVQRPHLPTPGFAPAVDLSLQQLQAIEDEPGQKLAQVLRKRHFGYPYGRPPMGIRAEMKRLTAPRLRADCRKRFTPQGSILSLAGQFDWPQLRDTVEHVFSPWKSHTPPTLLSRPGVGRYHHVRQKTNQVQIGLAYDSLPESHPHSLLAQTAVNVLSAGSGSRLFNEIREKQGLCYAIQASYHSFRDRASIIGYAATAPDRAQQTLDRFLHELHRMQAGITQDELDRAIVGMKAHLIMQGESTSARAAAMAYDYYHMDRLRTLTELRHELEAITLEQINDFLATHPLGPLTIVTVGPKPLKTHQAPS